MSEDRRIADQPRITFSLATASFVIAVICVLLAQYQAWGRHVILSWPPTLLLVAALVFHRRKELFWRNVALGVLAVPVLWWALAPTARDGLPYWQSQCSNNLKQVALAAYLYKDTHGSLPPPIQSKGDGKPGLSWRVTLLPFMEQEPLFKQFDLQQPWDSSFNRPLADALRWSLYRCNAEMNQRHMDTSYVAITGDDTCWPGDSAVNLGEIPDGAANTILFAETHDSGILWPEPRDLAYDQLDWRIHGTPGNSISSSHGPVIEYFDGSRKLKQRTKAHVALADGSVRRLSPDVDPEVLKQMANRRDGLPTELP